jgi:hypothetical protein
MKGDFSRWRPDRQPNVGGVLFQQGRVLLDSDTNEQMSIGLHWQEQAIRDAVGPNVAAVPAGDPDSFKVVGVKKLAGDVIIGGVKPAVLKIQVKPGAIWADGVLVELPPEDSGTDGTIDRVVERAGTPITRPPIITPRPPFPLDRLGPVRDAVILEVWREALSGFQMPDALIEPAIGGPDTTERVFTSMRFEVMSIGSGDTCETVADKLKDDPSEKGKLKVTLKPVETISDECPKVETGGYIGFEHHLYRVEIADVNRGTAPEVPWFKWSQFNGGLVGRGKCFLAASDKRIEITANDQAIKTSGLTDFYAEVVIFDDDQGRWRVVYGAKATLNEDRLVLGDAYLIDGKKLPAAGQIAFFRLWNGIDRIKAFPVMTASEEPEEMMDGIRLEFDAPTSKAQYRPGDYWTFEVRAGHKIGTSSNGEVLIGEVSGGGAATGVPPHGIRYHRVPLAILEWGIRPGTSPSEIKDCRRIFRPLTDMPAALCSMAIRPGDDVAEAVDEAIAAGGGCLCLLPGDHNLTRPLTLTKRANLRLTGFGIASKLHISSRLGSNAPFALTGSSDITFDSFAVISQGKAPVWVCGDVRNLEVRNMLVYTPLSETAKPLFAVEGTNCYGWRLERNFFVGPTGLSGHALYKTTISHNIWCGVTSGIDLDNIMDVQIQHNRFIGLANVVAAKVPALAEKLKPVEGTEIGELAALRRAENPFLGLLNLCLDPDRVAIDTGYTAIAVANVFDAEISGNYMMGGTGIDTEVVGTSLVGRNRFITTTTGAVFGIANELRFSENSVGVRMTRGGETVGVPCQVGLRILSHSVECEFLNNSFRNVREGIVFETDIEGTRQITRDFRSSVLADKADLTASTANAYLSLAKSRVTKQLGKYSLVPSTYFKMGKCSRTVIEGNLFECTELGIEWSGTRNITDFRISGNAFHGCQDVAIQIEPDDNVFFITEPTDTKVRLIEKNRFQVYSGAIRSTIGSVRFEKNDVRVSSPPREIPQLKTLVAIMAEHVYRSDDMGKAVEEDDAPAMRAITKTSTRKAANNPSSMDAARTVAVMSSRILAAHDRAKGDTYTDTAYVLANLANINAKKYVVAVANNAMAKWTNTLEGYVVNLSGSQNKVIHNRIYSTYPSFHGGVLFDGLSGEIRDNDIAVSRIGLLMSGKLGTASSLERNAEITSNSIRISGVRASEDRLREVAALVIPSLTPAHLSITGNYFEGSVSIGCDAMSFMGLYERKRGLRSSEMVNYNPGATTETGATMMIANIARGAVKEERGQAYTLTKVRLKELVTTFSELLEEVVARRLDPDPHKNQPVVHFTGNRIVCGALGLARTIASAHVGGRDFEEEGSNALIANVSNNVIDYWGVIGGYELVITGNQSQWPIIYSSGGKAETQANIPKAKKYSG